METPATPPLADKMAALSVRAPKEKKVKEAKEAAPKAAAGGKDVKKETQLGLSVTREQDFGAWYSQASVEQHEVCAHASAAHAAPRCPGGHRRRDDRVLRRFWLLHPASLVLQHLGEDQGPL